MTPKALTSDDIKHEMKLEKLYYVIKHRDVSMNVCSISPINIIHVKRLRVTWR